MNNSRNLVRIVCIILAALFVIPMLIAAISSLTGCSLNRSIPQENLVPYEELLENVMGGMADYGKIPDDFKGIWSSYEDGEPPAAAVKVEVLSCRNFCEYIVDEDYHEYLGRTGKFNGRSEYEIRITEVADKYNTLGVKRGQKKRLYQDNYIRFENFDDTLALFSEKLGKQITDLDALRDAGGGEVELAPVKGKEYEYCIFDYEFPMKVGESYTMLLLEKNDGVDKDKFYGFCICPAYDNIIPAWFARDHGFDYVYAQAAASLSLLFED
ncbi:MAG: hypothetical protein II871_04450 [Clostridia bacterium]|nr:hypothetical protein [Clostridia bacterium]